jgi:hypothetical protein
MASILKVDKLDPQSGTALEIGTSGDTITVPSGATLDISSATLTPPATLPASSGVNLTALNASNLGSGTVPTARLGTGTASSSTVLYGDQTYKAEPSGSNVLIATRTPSGASLIHFDDTEITSTYKRYIIDLINLNGASAAQFRCRFVNSGGDMTSDYYRWAMKVHSSNNNNWDTYSGANTEHIALTDLNTESGDAYPLSYRIFLEDPSSTSMYPAMFWTGLAISTDDYVMCINGAGYYYNSTAAIEGIKIYFSSGNIDSGYAKLYGVV